MESIIKANNSFPDALHCDEGALLGVFGLIVQAFLAVAAFMLLICKYILCYLELL